MGALKNIKHDLFLEDSYKIEGLVLIAIDAWKGQKTH